MKNVLIFHLESVSNVILKMHEKCFPNLRKLINENDFYPNYYSTATSTYMVVSDLFFGDTTQFEKSEYLEDIFSVEPISKSILDNLYSLGYRTKCYCYGFSEKEEASKHVNVYSRLGEYWETLSDVEGMLHDIRDYISQDLPFAIFVHDIESHWMNMQHIGNDEVSSRVLFFEKYYMLDRTLGKVLDELRKSGKYDETLIVIYGDHGDDLWGHGLHDGYTHAIEPYPFMVNCPLVLINNNKDILSNTALVSTIDIYDVINEYVGIDFKVNKREFTFSRNLFANQDVSRKSFNKSYMVTDGNYSLLVSGFGLKMYCNVLDITNNRNLLDFFELSHSGNLKYKNIFNNISASHYKYFMTSAQIQDICHEFSILFKALKGYLDELYHAQESRMDFSRIDYSIDVSKKSLLFRLYRRYIICRLKSLIKHVLVRVLCKENK